MRKKVERLERRDQKSSKKEKQLNLTDGIFGKEYLNNLQELDKEEKQEDDWKAIRKHPVTKIIMVVGITMGLVYMSSHVFNLAAKAATSYKKFRRALDS